MKCWFHLQQVAGLGFEPRQLAQGPLSTLLPAGADRGLRLGPLSPVFPEAHLPVCLAFKETRR